MAEPTEPFDREEIETSVRHARDYWKANLRPDVRSRLIGHWVPQLLAYIDTLEAALQPFARVADVYDFYVEEACPEVAVYPLDDVRIADEGPGRVALMREDFERVRDAMLPATGSAVRGAKEDS